MERSERLKLLADAGHFRDELETDPLMFEDDKGPTRSVVQYIGGIGFAPRGVAFSDSCFVGRFQPAPITTRIFREPLVVKAGAIVARILKWVGW